jgi:hypothetical protein
MHSGKSGCRECLQVFEKRPKIVSTTVGGTFSKPLASVTILEVKHVLENGEAMTHGSYRVDAVFGDDKPHFNGFAKIL